MANIVFTECRGGERFRILFSGVAVLVAIGAASALYMEHFGHIVTGMSNEIVWGLPHVFAVFLILIASGVLNIASLGSVFGEMRYKPKARLSGVLAITFLVGGLAILVLDLGRPDRLTVAMTNYNFRSIFAWNVLLYSGFMAVVAAYLVVQMTRGWQRFTPIVGLFAFLWRLVLTTGTGSIFGFLMARTPYASAVMAPMFIAMSLAYGLAVFVLIRLALENSASRGLGEELLQRLMRLQVIFVGSVAYFSGVFHFTSIYTAWRVGFEGDLLIGGGLYTWLFWIGFVLLGTIVPMALTYRLSRAESVSRGTEVLASSLVLVGGFVHVYVIIIGGQAFPLTLFPGYEVTSSFNDGVVATYVPTLPELGLGVGGVGLALLLAMIAMRLFRLLPQGELGGTADAR
jgi:molybdopterin-containing oxidoreductase family membrane subunit